MRIIIFVVVNFIHPSDLLLVKSTKRRSETFDKMIEKEKKKKEKEEKRLGRNTARSLKHSKQHNELCALVISPSGLTRGGGRRAQTRGEEKEGAKAYPCRSL